MRLIFSMFIAYLIGSIPTGYLIAKTTKNIDIRKTGSGNVGATNVRRAVGRLAALATLVIDILKGFVVVSFLSDMMYSYKMDFQYPAYVAALGLCVVVGHNWPIFLDFKGGKGVATSIGVLLPLCPHLLLIGLAVWILVFAIKKIVSLASIIAAASIPVASYFFEMVGAVRFLAAVLALLIIISHRANITRILKKEEMTI